VKIVIGKSGGKNVTLDLEVLLATRALLTADSGGGKTFALKRICEQASGKIQILIVDPEGEFSPLREKFNFVLVGKGGETPADVRSAALVAHTLMKLRASAICDIFELKPSERHAWVRAFLTALIEAPKETRHPCLVIVDEAHMFCPEKGKGESEASDAMRDLCTRGRKRLLCPLFATQRLATLSKDASSMLLNRMIGPTFEDLNRKRAADILSITKEDQREFFKQIQTLEPGNFFCLGRAISKERILAHIGPITSAHGQEALKYEMKPPPAPSAIAKLLPKLADLPKAAEEQATTVAEFKSEIRSLKAQLRSSALAAHGTQPKAPVEVKMADPRVIAHAVLKAREDYEKQFAEIRAYQRSIYNALVKAWELLGKVIDLKTPLSMARPTLQTPVLSKIPSGAVPVAPMPARRFSSALEARPVVGSTPAARSTRSGETNGDFGELTPYQVDILGGLAMLEGIGRAESKRALVAAAAGKAVKSSTFERYTSRLRSAGLIRIGPGTLALTEEGRKIAPASDEALSSEELHKKVLALFTPYQQGLLRALLEEHPSSLTRPELGERARQSWDSSTFERYLSALRAAEVIEYPDRGHVKAADWLFID